MFTLVRRSCPAANKAVLVNLGNREAGYAFDTDTLRGAGAWTGGWMQTKGVAFDGKHGPNPGPAVGAKVYFETNPGPGWSFNGTFNETRTLPKGPEGVMAKIALGPLPREHAKYQGLYLNGDRVVFAYSVGAAEVLESAEMEKVGDVVVLDEDLRTAAMAALNISRHKARAHALAAKKPCAARTAINAS